MKPMSNLNINQASAGCISAKACALAHSSPLRYQYQVRVFGRFTVFVEEERMAWGHKSFPVFLEVHECTSWI